MATMPELEAHTRKYAAARGALSDLVHELNEEIGDAKRRHLKAIKAAVATAREHQAALAAEIDASRELFAKPRTVIFHGVKIGLQKGKGSVDFDDEEKTIQRIRKLLPTDQAELLIHVEESVQKSAVYDLSVEDLKRLGITVEGTGDVVVIRDTAGEVDKLVKALLKEHPEEVAA